MWRTSFYYFVAEKFKFCLVLLCTVRKLRHGEIYREILWWESTTWWYNNSRILTLVENLKFKSYFGSWMRCSVTNLSKFPAVIKKTFKLAPVGLYDEVETSYYFIHGAFRWGNRRIDFSLHAANMLYLIFRRNTSTTLVWPDRKFQHSRVVAFNRWNKFSRRIALVKGRFRWFMRGFQIVRNSHSNVSFRWAEARLTKKKMRYECLLPKEKKPRAVKNKIKSMWNH